MDAIQMQINARERAVFYDQLREDPELANWLGLPVVNANPRALIGNRALMNGKGVSAQSSSNDIIRLQQMLQVYSTYEGFPKVTVTGKYDAATTAAVKFVQQQNNLSVTGQADELTMRTIESDYAASGGTAIQTTAQKTWGTVGSIASGIFGAIGGGAQPTAAPAAAAPPEEGPNYMVWIGGGLLVLGAGGLIIWAATR